MKTTFTFIILSLIRYGCIFGCMFLALDSIVNYNDIKCGALFIVIAIFINDITINIKIKK